MRYAFIDPETAELVAWGLMESNRPGDVRIEIPEDFNLEPGKWHYAEGATPEWIAIADPAA